MNITQELELIDNQLTDLQKERNLLRLMSIFEKIQSLNSKLSIESCQLVVFDDDKFCIVFSAEKDGQEIENSLINLVFQKHGIEPLSKSFNACFIHSLVEHKPCTTINIKNSTTLDEFFNTYIASEYNSRYLYRKMLPEFENTEEKINKKSKI